MKKIEWRADNLDYSVLPVRRSSLFPHVKPVFFVGIVTSIAIALGLLVFFAITSDVGSYSQRIESPFDWLVSIAILTAIGLPIVNIFSDKTENNLKKFAIKNDLEPLKKRMTAGDIIRHGVLFHKRRKREIFSSYLQSSNKVPKFILFEYTFETGWVGTKYSRDTVENNNNQALEFIPSSGRKLHHTISWDIWILITSPISLSLGLALLLRVAERYPQFEHSPIIFGFSFVLAIIFLGARRYFR